MHDRQERINLIKARSTYVISRSLRAKCISYCIHAIVSISIITLFITITTTTRWNKKEEYYQRFGGRENVTGATSPLQNPLIVGWTTVFQREMPNSFTACEYQCVYMNRKEFDGNDTNKELERFFVFNKNLLWRRVKYERSLSTHKQIPSAYIFHMRDIKPFDLPEPRYSHQIMVFYLQESPIHIGNAAMNMPKDYFNATDTYRLDSTYFRPYGRYKKRKEEDQAVQAEIETAVSKKTKGAIVFMSNCDTSSKREDYIKELGLHTKITIGGSCSIINYEKECQHSSQCEKELLEEHRFYLAFENSICKDYITEKFFERMKSFLVPVVLRRNIYEIDTIPPGSFIAADDFESPKHLADYLNQLSNNNTAYMKYFDYMKTYESDVSGERGICNLCRDIHQKKNMTIPDIFEFYVNNKCDESHEYTRKGAKWKPK